MRCPFDTQRRPGGEPPGLEIFCLFREPGVDQLDQAIHSSLLIGAVRNNADGGTAHDAKAQNAEQALGVDAALFFFNPDGRLILVRLLDEEGSRTSVQTDLILNGNFFHVHSYSLLLLKIICPCVSTVGACQAVSCVRYAALIASILSYFVDFVQ